MLAEAAARQMISHDPSYAGGYLALALADKHKGNAPGAAQEFATAQRLWSKADTPLRPPEVQNP
jgi:Tfp pilus assembly protein PilF